MTEGVPGPLQGAPSTAFGLDGSSGYLYTDQKVAGPQTYTAEVWVRTTTTTGGKLIGFESSQTGGSGSDDRSVYMTSAGHIVFGVYPNEVVTVASTGSYNDGAWHLVDATQGPGGLALYVDGTLVASAVHTTAAQAYQGYWRIGGGTLGGWPGAPAHGFLAGDVADAAVYPAALDAAAVGSHYSAAGYQATPAGVSVVSPADQQTIAGFGASGDWWTTDLQYFPPAQRERMMQLLLSSGQGIGLTQYRYNVGGGGVGADVSTPDESELGAATRAPGTFFVAPGIYDWSHDAGGTLFLNLANRYHPAITAQANSAPPYFTSNHQSCGGTLPADQVAGYAQYLETVVEHLWRVDGVHFANISPMNEPQYTRSDCTQEGMAIPPAERAQVVTDLHSDLVAAGLPVGILADESSQVGSQFVPELPQWVNQPGVQPDLQALATHTYDFPQAPTLQAGAAAARAAHLPLDMTEICCVVRDSAGYVTFGAGYDPTITGGVNFADLVMKDLVYGGFRSWDWWVGASAALGCDPATQAGCATTPNSVGYNDGLVYYDPNFAIDHDYSLYVTKRLWALGNFSRFVQPGATLHYVSGGDPALHTVAFHQADGQWVVVVINNAAAGSADVPLDLALPGAPTDGPSRAYRTSATGDLAQAAGLTAGPNGTYQASVPAQSITTYVIGG